MDLFRSNFTPETARLGEFGRHVFEVAELSRVPYTVYNLRVWVVGRYGPNWELLTQSSNLSLDNTCR
jgi:hypothetical protein